MLCVRIDSSPDAQQQNPAAAHLLLSWSQHEPEQNNRGEKCLNTVCMTINTLGIKDRLKTLYLNPISYISKHGNIQAFL